MNPTVKHLVVMGDSLSDRGTMDHRKLFGLIPMDGLASLTEKKTPDGRFTNGYNWADDVASSLALQFIINEIKYYHEDITDEGIVRAYGTCQQNIEAGNTLSGLEQHLYDLITGSFFLGDDLHVRFQGKDLMRSYAEGGLTAHDYKASWWGLNIFRPKESAAVEGARLTVASLAEKRAQLVQDDTNHHLSKTHKAESLIIEWSGANDLITANLSPNIPEVNLAIDARVDNIEKLIAQGYKNFALYGLPNLALTPRFQREDTNTKSNAKATSLQFNLELARRVESLQQAHPDCKIVMFDINQEFQNIYDKPEDYDFDPQLKTTPYTQSEEFKKEGNQAPAKGYMFWDDVHPSATMHSVLAKKAKKFLESNFSLESPREPGREFDIKKGLVNAFKSCYDSRFKTEKSQFLVGLFRRSRLRISDTQPAEENLKQIFKHALYNGGNRTLDILKQLNWLDEGGQLPDADVPIGKAIPSVLRRTYNEAVAEHTQQSTSFFKPS